MASELKEREGSIVGGLIVTACLMGGLAILGMIVLSVAS